MSIAFDRTCSVYSMMSSVKRSVKRSIHVCMRCRTCSIWWRAQSRDQSRDWFMSVCVAELVLFDDWLNKEIIQNHSLLSIVKLQNSTKLESESLSCDMYEALNNVRIMSRASHKDTGKRRVNQVNENSKLKSEIYEMQRLYIQRKDER